MGVVSAIGSFINADASRTHAGHVYTHARTHSQTGRQADARSDRIAYASPKSFNPFKAVSIGNRLYGAVGAF